MYNHHNFFITSGVLFCVGGRGATGDPFKTVECYDPRKNRWFQVAEMNTRRRHVGVCSVNGMSLSACMHALILG